MTHYLALIFSFSLSTCQSSSLFKVDSEDSSKDTIIQNTRQASIPKLPDTLTIIGVGDMMLGSNFPSKATLPEHPEALLQTLTPYLQNASLTFGNIEGVFLNEGGTSKGSGANVYSFRQPEVYASYLKDAGFDVFSVANNHVNDFGTLGRHNTMKVLDALGMPYAGFIERPDIIFEHKGVRYGFAAFAPNKGCADFMDLEQAQARVRYLAQHSDVVLVSFHAGAEGAKAQHVLRKEELFYNQNRGNVYAFSHAMIDAGASVVFGHGPHVTRAVELYKNKFIAYSLGNFCTYGQFNLKGPNGVAPLIKVYTTAKGDFIKADVLSIKQEGEGGPILDPNYKAFQFLKTLTQEDFPETPLRFEENQYILKQN